MKKILLIAYHYYPDLSVGAQRTIKYAKYLPQFGWEPHVLTVASRYYPHRDDTPLGFERPVYRTSKWPLPDDIYKRIKKLTASPQSAQKVSREGPAQENGGETRVPPTWKRFLNSLSSTPDAHVGWFFPAVFKARRLMRTERFDAIYSSGPPHSCHLIALAIQRLTGTPWVADFRDPWAFSRERDTEVLSWTVNFDSKYEARSARHASLVIATTDEWRDALKSRYQHLLDDKCHTIINGYDDEDFDLTSLSGSRGASAPFKFLYAGNLYSGRDPSAMITAAGELLSEGAVGPDDLAFEFYGNNDIDMNRIDRIVAEYGLGSMVSFRPPVGRDSYIKLLCGADVLILIQAEQARVHIPAKAFEYLGTGNEILTLTSEGSTKNFMSKFDQVSVAELNSTEQIKLAIKKHVSRLKDPTSRAAAADRLKTITKRYLTQQFAALLDGIVAR